MGLTFEWTFKLGDVFTLFGALVVAAAFLYRKGGEGASVNITLTALAKEFTEMKTEFKGFAETLQTVAVQEVKIGLLMKWYDELRHGQGFVRGSRTSIDGEYPPS